MVGAVFPAMFEAFVIAFYGVGVGPCHAALVGLPLYRRKLAAEIDGLRQFHCRLTRQGGETAHHFDLLNLEVFFRRHFDSAGELVKFFALYLCLRSCQADKDE